MIERSGGFQSLAPTSMTPVARSKHCVLIYYPLADGPYIHLSSNGTWARLLVQLRWQLRVACDLIPANRMGVEAVRTTVPPPGRGPAKLPNWSSHLPLTLGWCRWSQWPWGHGWNSVRMSLFASLIACWRAAHWWEMLTLIFLSGRNKLYYVKPLKLSTAIWPSSPGISMSSFKSR